MLPTPCAGRGAGRGAGRRLSLPGDSSSLPGSGGSCGVSVSLIGTRLLKAALPAASAPAFIRFLCGSCRNCLGLGPALPGDAASASSCPDAALGAPALPRGPTCKENVKVQLPLDRNKSEQGPNLPFGSTIPCSRISLPYASPPTKSQQIILTRGAAFMLSGFQKQHIYYPLTRTSGDPLCISTLWKSWNRAGLEERRAELRTYRSQGAALRVESPSAAKPRYQTPSHLWGKALGLKLLHVIWEMSNCVVPAPTIEPSTALQLFSSHLPWSPESAAGFVQSILMSVLARKK